MGNNKRGKMLPEFKEKKFFFHTAESRFQNKQIVKHSCLCDIVIVCALTRNVVEF